jgi:hypothetical protein
MELYDQKLHKAHLAQDGHSLGEEAVYYAFWNRGRGRVESADAKGAPSTKIVTIGWDKLATISRMDWSNAKKNCLALIKKLSIEKVADHKKRIGTTYRIYSYGLILSRRKKVGLTHFIRNRGKVTLVNPNVKVKESMICEQSRVCNLPTVTVCNLPPINGMQSTHPF